MQRRTLLLIMSVPPLLGGVALAMPEGAGAINTEAGIAIRGYDPVAYFTLGQPTRGRRDIAADWNGARWQFATPAHRALFLAEPGRYAPAFGGFCAYAVSEGYTASIDPRAWRIVDGRLYLNYSLDIQRRWEGDISGRISRGETNWPRLRDGG